MWYIIVAVASFVAGLVVMYLFKKKVDAQVQRTVDQIKQ
jgi:hypothetical protein